MQKGQASISRVKATDREGDAARKEISTASHIISPGRHVGVKFELVSTIMPHGRSASRLSLLAPADEVIERVALHESGTFVTLTPAGAELFA